MTESCGKDIIRKRLFDLGNGSYSEDTVTPLPKGEGRGEG